MLTWIIIGVTLFGSAIGTTLLFCFIREGVKDDFAYPFDECDTSVFEENINQLGDN